MLELALEPFKDPCVQEIFVRGIASMTVLRSGLLEVRSSPYSDRGKYLRFLQEFSLEQGLRLDPYSPSAGGRLERKYEGVSLLMRWHCLVPPASPIEPIFALRRHHFSSLELSDFSMSVDMESKLRQAFVCGDSFLFCGPTGSGKTSFLFSLLKMFCLNERLIFLEELEEIPMVSLAWTALRSRKIGIDGKGAVSLSFLLNESLRLRPDRLVIGELRTLDSLVFLDALWTGHHGTLSTFHAMNLTDVQQRIGSMLQKDGRGLSHFSSRSEKPFWCVFLRRQGAGSEIVSMDPFSFSL